MNNYYPKARSLDLVVQPVGDEMLVYDLKIDKACCLNETAAFVWSKCKGDISLDEIGSSLSTQFGQTKGFELTQLAISQLSERELLIEPAPFEHNGTSRREMLKTLGAASAAAVPIIGSLVAPPRALGNISCICTSPASCSIQQGCPNNCNSLGYCGPDPGPRPT